MSPTDLSKLLCAASKMLNLLIHLSAPGLCLCEDSVCQHRIITVNKSLMTCDYLSIVLHLLHIRAFELKKQKNKYVAPDYLLFFWIHVVLVWIAQIWRYKLRCLLSLQYY